MDLSFLDWFGFLFVQNRKEKELNLTLLCKIHILGEERLVVLNILI